MGLKLYPGTGWALGRKPRNWIRVGLKHSKCSVGEPSGWSRNWIRVGLKQAMQNQEFQAIKDSQLDQGGIETLRIRAAQWTGRALAIGSGWD